MNESTKSEIRNTQKIKDPPLLRGESVEVCGLREKFTYLKSAGEFSSLVNAAGRIEQFSTAMVHRI